jgi:hypothetical protein
MFELDQKTNANRVRNVQPKTAELGSLIRFYKIANDLVNGLSDLFVLRTPAPEDFKRHFERILHISLQVSNTSLTSWSIFRQNREWDAEPEEEHFGLVLRQARWDTITDLSKESYKRHNTQPSVTITTRYMTDDDCDDLLNEIQILDRLLIAGVNLEMRPETVSGEWDEIAISRAFDWGGVNLTWNVSRYNDRCETAAIAVTRTMEAILKEHSLKHPNTIEAIDMLYPSSRPETTALLFPSSPAQQP